MATLISRDPNLDRVPRIFQGNDTDGYSEVVITQDTVTQTILTQTINARVGTAIVLNTTKYVALDASSAETPQTNDPSDTTKNITEFAWQATEAATINNLYVRANLAPGNGETFIVTVMKNGVAQTLTATVSGTGVTASDTTHSFNVVAGDLVSVKVAVSATATNSFKGTISTQYISTP